MKHRTFFWFFLPTGLAMLLFIFLPIISVVTQSLYTPHDAVLETVKNCGPFGCTEATKVNQDATEALRAAFEANSDALFGFFEGLDEDVAQVKPEGKWSILEHGEHLFVAEKGTGRIFQGPTTEVNRDVQELVTSMRDNFLDMGKRFRAGGPILPKGRFASIAELRAAMAANRAELIALGDRLG